MLLQSLKGDWNVQSGSVHISHYTVNPASWNFVTEGMLLNTPIHSFSVMHETQWAEGRQSIHSCLSLDVYRICK